MTISYQPIGTIHSPFEGIEKVPIQPAAASGIRGTVEVFAEFAAGLQDVHGFSHIILLYHFHRVTQARLTVIPFLDDQPRGVFATRAPSRPNPIGLSIVRLLGIEGSVLYVENVDIVDGTPLLDIKPYVPAFDHNEVEQTGWLETTGKRVKEKRSDDRFK
jgi:tRNA-Thr(GGU) m(6)t(6)A37 methyltransferase TsaA